VCGVPGPAQHIHASPAAAYAALLSAAAVGRWRVPDGMRSRVHQFDAREGGSFRVTLTYDEATATGKSGAHTDTYHGTFVALVTDRMWSRRWNSRRRIPRCRAR
jgi:uncharacterized protein YndB with AHSA1/START domain